MPIVDFLTRSALVGVAGLIGAGVGIVLGTLVLVAGIFGHPDRITDTDVEYWEAEMKEHQEGRRGGETGKTTKEVPPNG